MFNSDGGKSGKRAGVRIFDRHTQYKRLVIHCWSIKNRYVIKVLGIHHGVAANSISINIMLRNPIDQGQLSLLSDSWKEYDEIRQASEGIINHLRLTIQLFPIFGSTLLNLTMYQRLNEINAAMTDHKVRCRIGYKVFASYGTRLNTLIRHECWRVENLPP